jgi:hypothetical protein
MATPAGPASLRVAPDGAIESAEGWVVRVLAPDLLEYCDGGGSCLVNVGYEPAARARAVYASESASDLFPRLAERLQCAARHFKGHYVVV